MEPVIAFVVFVSLIIWADDSKEESIVEHDVTTIYELQNDDEMEINDSAILTEASISNSEQYLGYKIKDLSIKTETPEGCHRAVLTSDLSVSSGVDGVRNVNEVKMSCEG